MERKEFLRKSLSGLGFLTVASLVAACQKEETTPSSTTGSPTTGSTNGNSSSNCTVTNTETAGPYPIHEPSSLVRSNIIGERPGVNLSVNITIKNKNADCAALPGVLVDIWHCDALGNYSEYGSLTAVSWLRGRQTTNSNGQVSFTSIFPGWYRGRSPHIHVHVYNANGNSLLITQIAFPDELCQTLYTTAPDYVGRGVHDTLLRNDSIFRDGYANELGTFSGDIASGYTLAHSIVVNG